MCDRCTRERTGKTGWLLVVLIVAIAVGVAVLATTPGLAAV